MAGCLLAASTKIISSAAPSEIIEGEIFEGLSPRYVQNAAGLDLDMQ